MRFSDVFSGSESAKKRFGFSKFSRVGALAAGRVDRGGVARGRPSLHTRLGVPSAVACRRDCSDLVCLTWVVVAVVALVCGQISLCLGSISSSLRTFCP